MEIMQIRYNGQNWLTCNSAGDYFCLNNSGVVIKDRVLFVDESGNNYHLDPPHFRGMCRKAKPCNTMDIRENKKDKEEFQVVVNHHNSQWVNYFDLGFCENNLRYSDKPIAFDITDDWLVDLNGNPQSLDDYVFNLKHWVGSRCKVVIKSGDYYVFKCKNEKVSEYIRLWNIIYPNKDLDLRKYYSTIVNNWHEHDIDRSFKFVRTLHDGLLFVKDMDIQIKREVNFSADKFVCLNGNIFERDTKKFIINNPAQFEAFLTRLVLIKDIENVSKSEFNGFTFYVVVTETGGYRPHSTVFIIKEGKLRQVDVYNGDCKPSFIEVKQYLIGCYYNMYFAWDTNIKDFVATGNGDEVAARDIGFAYRSGRNWNRIGGLYFG